MAPIVHVDIIGPDDEALRHFYGELLAWEITPAGPGYALVETGAGSPKGALVEGGESNVVLGVQVDDLDLAVERACRLGAEVVMPPTDNGWVVKAQVRDPAGNLLTLIAG